MRGGALLGLLMIALGGCATERMFEGPARPAGEVAVIHAASRFNVLFNPNPVYVQSIDGRAVGPSVSTLVVEPGEHTLVTRCRANLIYGSTHEITLDADPGIEYRLESLANPSTHCEVRAVAD